MAVAPLSMLPFLIFGGFFTSAGAIRGWIGWFKWCSFFFYSFGALMKNQFTGQSYSCPNTTMARCFRNGEEVLTTFGFSDVVIWGWALVLLAFFFFFKIMTLLVLLYRCRNKTRRPKWGRKPPPVTEEAEPTSKGGSGGARLLGVPLYGIAPMGLEHGHILCASPTVLMPMPTGEMVSFPCTTFEARPYGADVEDTSSNFNEKGARRPVMPDPQDIPSV